MYAYDGLVMEEPGSVISHFLKENNMCVIREGVWVQWAQKHLLIAQIVKILKNIVGEFKIFCIYVEVT